MGNFCTSCCDKSSYEDLTPDVEVRRQQQMEAAERRLAEQEQRGVKNIESVRRQQQKALDREKLEREAGNTSTQNTLRWQMS